MRLILDEGSFVLVVIFRILTGQAGSRLASWRNLILTFLIRQFVRRSGTSVRLDRPSASIVRSFGR